MQENRQGILYFSAAALCALTLSAPGGLRASEPQVLSNAVANAPLQFDVSPPLTRLMDAKARQGPRLTHAPLLPKLGDSPVTAQNQGKKGAAAVQSLVSPANSAAIGQSFAGIGITADSTLDCGAVIGGALAPPDTNAAVGDTQVVQWVNICYAVFDKSSGAVLAGPLAGNAFWKGFGGPCETSNDGDPIIQWDKHNHRWVAAQNVFEAPYMTCIAISQTADATGSYYRYAFPQPGFPDYPKWGLTRSTYYQTQNIFDPILVFGVNVCAYDAKAMLKGRSNAKQVCIFDDSNGTYFDDNMVPADDDADAGGPTNREILLGAIDNFLPGDTHVYEYVFEPNFGNPAKSTLAGVAGSMPIDVPAFDLAICAGQYRVTDCVQQPGTIYQLDTLGDRLMYRLAHFNERGTQHFVVTHSVNNGDGTVAVRWYEFRAQGLGTTRLSLYQWGQTPDDGKFRWMGSGAMDQNGNIAIGYSRSSAAAGDYPSIYYATHQAGDLPGATDAEALIKQGLGSQTDTEDRWGDYSSMALDGADSCTFWYTNQFNPVTGRFTWATWLASLKFPGCGP